MIKFSTLIVVTAVLAFLVTTLGGCGDDVKTVHKSERIHESEPQMVPPGQEVIE